MKRYVIQNKTTKEFVQQVNSGYNRNRLVASADDATFFTSKSAITHCIRALSPPHQRPLYSAAADKAQPDKFNYKCIEVRIILFPANTQPFMDGF